MVHDQCISRGPTTRLLRLDEPISLKSWPSVGNSSAIHSVPTACPTAAVWLLGHLRRQLWWAFSGRPAANTIVVDRKAISGSSAVIQQTKAANPWTLVCQGKFRVTELFRVLTSKRDLS